MDEALKQRMAAHLGAFCSDISGVRNAVIASVDGFALVSASNGQGKGERLAAMTSAMLALAAAVGRELELGELEVLMLALPASPHPLLLMAACDQGCVIGKVLWRAKECGRGILAELGGT